MKIERIISNLNSYLIELRNSNNIKDTGMFILQKRKSQYESIPIYKVYTYKLWYLDTNKNKHLIFEIKNTEKDSTKLKIDDMLILECFNFIRTDKFNDIVYGRSIKNTNE